MKKATFFYFSLVLLVNGCLGARLQKVASKQSPVSTLVSGNQYYIKNPSLSLYLAPVYQFTNEKNYQKIYHLWIEAVTEEWPWYYTSSNGYENLYTSYEGTDYWLSVTSSNADTVRFVTTPDGWEELDITQSGSSDFCIYGIENEMYVGVSYDNDLDVYTVGRESGCGSSETFQFYDV